MATPLHIADVLAELLLASPAFRADLDAAATTGRLADDCARSQAFHELRSLAVD